MALAGHLQEILLDSATLEASATRLHEPTPRVALGNALRGIAHAAIDISDGLAGDLGHILERSKLGAILNADAVPVGPALHRLPPETRRRYALAGGDDYELCFTAPASNRDAVLAAARSASTPVTRVGRMTAESGLHLVDSTGAALDLALHSFDHFNSP
jgi:thiamine-monophosphate kinase